MIIETLGKHPNGYYNAYMAISRNTRMIYVHAYQSYIWNTVVSQRLAETRDVIEGDIVIVDGQPKVLTAEETSRFALNDVVFPLIGKTV